MLIIQDAPPLIRRIALAVLVGIFCAATGNAQSNAIDAAIEGYVHDASGGAIQRATISARNTYTNVQSDTLTNADGYFRFPLLQVGQYRLTAQAEGFKALTKTSQTYLKFPPNADLRQCTVTTSVRLFKRNGLDSAVSKPVASRRSCGNAPR